MGFGLREVCVSAAVVFEGPRVGVGQAVVEVVRGALGEGEEVSGEVEQVEMLRAVEGKRRRGRGRHWDVGRCWLWGEDGGVFPQKKLARRDSNPRGSCGSSF